MQRRKELGRWSTALLAALGLWACGGGEATPIDVNEQDVALLSDHVDEATFQQACDRLGTLCQEKQKGCEAHKKFCDGGATLADLEARICAKLQQVCDKFPRACGIVQKHCTGSGGGGGSRGDGGAAPGGGGQVPPHPRADGGVPPVPPLPGRDGGAKLPDRAVCCAALKVCVDSKGQDCQAAVKACSPTGALPSLPPLPGGQLPGGVTLEQLLKQVYDKLCSQPATP